MTFTDTARQRQAEPPVGAWAPSAVPGPDLDSQPRRRHRRAKRSYRTTVLALTAALCAIAAAGTAAWPHIVEATATSQATLQLTAHIPTGAVKITSVDTSLWWPTTQQASATIWLQNTSDQPLDARTWWIVGRVGDARPWTDAVLFSPEREVRLAAHESAQVVVAAPSLPPPGTYTLSFWAHDQANGAEGFTPSDGTALTSSLLVRPVGATLVHVSGSQTSLLIGDVTLHGSSATRTARVTIANVVMRPNTAVVSVTAGGVTRNAKVIVDQLSTATVKLPAGAASTGAGVIRVSVGTLRPGGTPDEQDVVLVES